MKSPLIALLASLSLCCTLAHADDQPIFGLHEQVLLPELDLALPAKLDTGAETASLSARNIETFEKDGAQWVRFQLAVGEHAEPRTLVRPLLRMGYIKRRAGDIAAGDEAAYTARPVITMPVCLGDSRQRIEVNLTDRSHFDYPLLIGARALKDFDALIDPGRRFTSGRPDCA